jgi:hypothetical protein
VLRIALTRDGLAAALDCGASAASGQPEPRAIVAIVPWTLCVFASRFVLQSVRGFVDNAVLDVS